MLSDDASRVFQVEIVNSKTVGDLRKLIKEEKRPAFDHVPADTLVLWKVSIAINGNLAESLDPDIINDDPLLPVNRLSKVFSDPPEDEHLHIVMQAPPAGELDIVSIGVRFQFSYFITSAASSSMFKSANSHSHL